MMSENRQKPKYLGDLEDEETLWIRKCIILREMYDKGYEATFKRWGGYRRKEDYFLFQFQKASKKEIVEAIDSVNKKIQDIARRKNEPIT